MELRQSAATDCLHHQGHLQTTHQPPIVANKKVWLLSNGADQAQQVAHIVWATCSDKDNHKHS
jgi:hypothetical protein